MSSEEKHTWISALVGAAVPVAYLAAVLPEVPGTDAARSAYVGPMLTSIGVGIGACIVLAIMAAMALPHNVTRRARQPPRGPVPRTRNQGEIMQTPQRLTRVEKEPRCMR